MKWDKDPSEIYLKDITDFIDDLFKGNGNT